MSKKPSWADKIVTLLETRVPCTAAHIENLLGGYAGTSARLAELCKRGRVRKAGKQQDGFTVYTVNETVVPMSKMVLESAAAPEPKAEDTRKKAKVAPFAAVYGGTEWFIVKTKSGPFSNTPTAYRSSKIAHKVAKAIKGQVITAIEKETT